MKYRYPLCWWSQPNNNRAAHPVPEVLWEPVEIEVSEISSRDAPVVLETNDIKVRWYGSSHWYPFTANAKRSPSDAYDRPHKEALQIASETGDYAGVLTPKKNPLVPIRLWTQGAGDELGSRRAPPRRVLPGMETKDPEREEAVEEMKKAVRNTIIIDGFLWTRGGPPVLAAWRRSPELSKTEPINFVIDDIDKLCGDKNQKYYRKDWMMFSPQTPTRYVITEIRRQWPDLQEKNIAVPSIIIHRPETLSKNVDLIELKSQVAAAIGEWWGASVLSQASNEDAYRTPDWRKIDNKSISLLLNLKEALENTHRVPSGENIASLEIHTDTFIREAYPKESSAANYLSNALDRWMTRPESEFRSHSEAS